MSNRIRQAIRNLQAAEEAYRNGDLDIAHTFLIVAELDVEVARGATFAELSRQKLVS